MSATFCIVHCTKRPLNELVLAIKSVMQLHGTLETLNTTVTNIIVWHTYQVHRMLL